MPNVLLEHYHPFLYFLSLLKIRNYLETIRTKKIQNLRIFLELDYIHGFLQNQKRMLITENFTDILCRLKTTFFTVLRILVILFVAFKIA